MPQRSSLWSSFHHAFRGIGYCLQSQRNCRIHTAAAAVVIVVGLWLHLPATEWAILVVSIGTVWAAEMANTAVESAVDLASPEHHDLARIAKDSAAAAVLCTALTSVVVGLMILGPPLIEKCRS